MDMQILYKCIMYVCMYVCMCFMQVRMYRSIEVSCSEKDRLEFLD